MKQSCSTYFLAAILLLVTHIGAATATERHISAIAWSPNGEFFAAGYSFGGIEVYDSNGEIKKQISTPEGSPIKLLSWDNTSSRITAAGYGQLLVWEVASSSFTNVKRIEQDETSLLWSPIEPNELWLGSTGTDSTETFQVWDAITLKQLQGFDHLGSIHQLGYLITSESIFIGHSSGAVSIWDVSLSHRKSISNSSDFVNVGGVNTASLNPTGNRAITGHIYGTVILWDINLPEGRLSPIQILESANNSRVISVSFNVDGAKVFSIAADGTLRTWDTQTGQLLRDIQLGESVYAAAFSPDGTKLAIGGSVTQMTLIPAHIYDPAVIPTPTATFTSTPTFTPTPTDIPTSTPTPTSTLTPTSTPTPTIPARFSPLRLRAVCSPFPALFRVWRVENDNRFALPFTWQVVGTRQDGHGVALARFDSYFFTATVRNNPNTVRILVRGVEQDVEPSTSAQCR